MKTKEKAERLDEILSWAKSRLEWIEDQCQFQYEPALVEINAPLVLIQVDLGAQHECLNTVIKMGEGRSEDT